MNVTNSKANNIRRKIFILFLIAFVMVASGCNTQTVEPSDETQNNPTNQTPVEPETNNTTKPNVTDKEFEGYYEVLDGVYVNYFPGVYEEDIVLNEGKVSDWEVGKLDGVRKWKAIGSNADATQFKGTFDGQGHTISGLYGSYTTICNGMFATVGQGGCVTNLRLVNSFITSTTGYLGGIAGRSDGGSFSKIYSDATVRATGSTNGSDNQTYIGGLVGTAIGTTDGVDDILFRECWFAGNVDSASMRNGGIVGAINPSGASEETMYIVDCLFTGTIASTNLQHYVGSGTAGIVGSQTGTDTPIKFVNCIAVDDVSGGIGSDGNMWQFAGAILGATIIYPSKTVTIENCYVIGDKVLPVGILSEPWFTESGGRINGSANVVYSLEAARGIANESSVWTLVDGEPVLTIFKDIQP